MCLGGVNAHKGLRETLQSLGVTEVMEAMDMDQFTNPQVRQAITHPAPRGAVDSGHPVLSMYMEPAI